MENSPYEEMSDERPEGFEFPPVYQELISHAEESLVDEFLNHGPQKCDEEYYSRMLAKIQKLYEKENYQQGLPLLVPFLLKTGLSLPTRVNFYVKWLTYNLGVDIPDFDAFAPDDDYS